LGEFVMSHLSILGPHQPKAEAECSYAKRYGPCRANRIHAQRKIISGRECS
jgi:hypothetical protein